MDLDTGHSATIGKAAPTGATGPALSFCPKCNRNQLALTTVEAGTEIPYYTCAVCSAPVSVPRRVLADGSMQLTAAEQASRNT